jgi:hypothetical protein
MGSADPTNVTYPLGSITINPNTREITGSNAERQDFIIGPSPATGFRGYFCARFDHPFETWGTAVNGTVSRGSLSAEDKLLSGFATFANDTTVLNVRIGVSFISVEQARKNLENEIPDGTPLEHTAFNTRKEWAEKLDRVKIEGASDEDASTFYSALFHTLQVCSHSAYLHLFSQAKLSSTPTSKVKMGNTTLGTMILSTREIRTQVTRSGSVSTSNHLSICSRRI